MDVYYPLILVALSLLLFAAIITISILLARRPAPVSVATLEGIVYQLKFMMLATDASDRNLVYQIYKALYNSGVPVDYMSSPCPPLYKKGVSSAIASSAGAGCLRGEG